MASDLTAERVLHPRRMSSAASPVVLFGKEACDALRERNLENTAYWLGMLEAGPSRLVRNLKTTPGIITHGSNVWPITVNDWTEGNSYPCSLYSQYVTYPKEELSLVPGLVQRRTASAGLSVLGGLLRYGNVDRIVQIGSWLVSTNLHGFTLRESLPELTKALVQAFPMHVILVKNIHAYEDPSWPQVFENADYDLITSRQIYFFDGRDGSFLQKSTVRRDLKALSQLQDYRQVEHDQITVADVPRITELYRQLYLEKHSQLNPQYTELFVGRALEERWLEFRGLRHISGRLDAVYGCFSHAGVTSTPFIGYDTRLPNEVGFYRLLVSMLLKRVGEQRMLLNYSSGAGEFKRRRGATPGIEFNAVYTRHSDAATRMAFAGLRILANSVGRRFLEKEEI